MTRLVSGSFIVVGLIVIVMALSVRSVVKDQRLANLQNMRYYAQAETVFVGSATVDSAIVVYAKKRLDDQQDEIDSLKVALHQSVRKNAQTAEEEATLRKVLLLQSAELTRVSLQIPRRDNE